MSITRRLAPVVTVAALLLVPSTASALTSTVTGAIGTELSLAVATPAAMTITHGTPGASSSIVTVTSTNALWTLSLTDASGSTNPGHMNKVGAPTNFLSDALQWSSNGGTTWNNLVASGGPSVGTGSLVGTKTVNYQQQLAVGENVTALDAYTLTVTYTAS